MLDTYQFIHKINSPLLVLLDLVVLYHVDQARVQVVHLQGFGEHKYRLEPVTVLTSLLASW